MTLKRTHLIDFYHAPAGLRGPIPSVGRITVLGNPYDGDNDVLEIFNGHSRYVVEGRINLQKLRDALNAAYPPEQK